MQFFLNRIEPQAVSCAIRTERPSWWTTFHLAVHQGCLTYNVECDFATIQARFSKTCVWKKLAESWAVGEPIEFIREREKYNDYPSNWRLACLTKLGLLCLKCTNKLYWQSSWVANINRSGLQCNSRNKDSKRRRRKPKGEPFLKEALLGGKSHWNPRLHVGYPLSLSLSFIHSGSLFSQIWIVMADTVGGQRK